MVEEVWVLEAGIAAAGSGLLNLSCLFLLTSGRLCKKQDQSADPVITIGVFEATTLQKKVLGFFVFFFQSSLAKPYY